MKTKTKKLLAILSIVMMMMAIFAPSVFASNKAVGRMSGNDRYKTAIDVSLHTFTNATHVVLVDAFSYADAMAAAPLAVAYNAPILLVDTVNQRVTQETFSEMNRLGADYVFIIGGTNVINNTVYSTVTLAGYHVTRIAGADRYATSNEIALKLKQRQQSLGDQPYDCVVLVNGLKYEDALAASAGAAHYGYPIVYVQQNSIPSSVQSVVNAAARAFIVGGTSSISESLRTTLRGQGKTVSRLDGDVYGSDRYAISVDAADTFFGTSSNRICVVNGEDEARFPDALAASVFSAVNGYPLVLIRQNSIPSSVVTYINICHSQRGWIIGGTTVISTNAENSLYNYLYD